MSRRDFVSLLAILISAGTMTNANAQMEIKKAKVAADTVIVCKPSSPIQSRDEINDCTSEGIEDISRAKIWDTWELDRRPEFPGGHAALYRWLAANVKYPDECVVNNIEGKVLVQFTVMHDGSIVDVKAIKSAHPLLDNEALRVIKGMPKWQPGMKNDKPVNVFFNLPISFKIPPREEPAEELPQF